jgi:hypothetical protein
MFRVSIGLAIALNIHTSILRNSVHLASSADKGPILLIFGDGMSRNVRYDRMEDVRCTKRLTDAFLIDSVMQTI